MRHRLSPAKRRQCIAMLAEADQLREPVETVIHRDAIFDDRQGRWRERLPTVLFGTRTSNYLTLSSLVTRDVAYLRLLETDLALRAFREEHGRFPVGLDELGNPAGSSTIDPFSLAPFRYILQKDSFILYSVGQDLEDNGGHFGNSVAYVRENGYDLDLETSSRP